MASVNGIFLSALVTLYMRSTDGEQGPPVARADTFLKIFCNNSMKCKIIREAVK